MDKFEQLARDAEYALFLLANESTGDFELIEPQPIPTDAARGYSERGLSFGGVLALVGGKPRSALALPLEDATVDAIVREFIARVVYMEKHPRWMVPGGNA